MGFWQHLTKSWKGRTGWFNVVLMWTGCIKRRSKVLMVRSRLRTSYPLLLLTRIKFLARFCPTWTDFLQFSMIDIWNETDCGSAGRWRMKVVSFCNLIEVIVISLLYVCWIIPYRKMLHKEIACILHINSPSYSRCLHGNYMVLWLALFSSSVRTL